MTALRWRTIQAIVAALAVIGLVVLTVPKHRRTAVPHNYAGPEARQWLQSNGQEAPLAANRFRSKKEALDFINALYAAGATKVFIPTQDITDDEVERRQVGPYAEAVVAEID